MSSRITSMKEYNKMRSHLAALRVCKRMIQRKENRAIVRWYQRQEELEKLQAIQDDIYYAEEMKYKFEDWLEDREEQRQYFQRLDAIDDYFSD